MNWLDIFRKILKGISPFNTPIKNKDVLREFEGKIPQSKGKLRPPDVGGWGASH